MSRLSLLVSACWSQAALLRRDFTTGTCVCVSSEIRLTLTHGDRCRLKSSAPRPALGPGVRASGVGPARGCFRARCEEPDGPGPPVAAALIRSLVAFLSLCSRFLSSSSPWECAAADTTQLHEAKREAERQPHMFSLLFGPLPAELGLLSWGSARPRPCLLQR